MFVCRNCERYMPVGDLNEFFECSACEKLTAPGRTDLEKQAARETSARGGRDSMKERIARALAVDDNRPAEQFGLYLDTAEAVMKAVLGECVR